MNHVTSICRWTFLGLFFGLRGGFVPFIFQKSSAISSRDNDIVNLPPLPFSDASDPAPTISFPGQLFSAAKGEGDTEAKEGNRYGPFSAGALSAGLRVLRFHGLTASAAAEEENDLSTPPSLSFKFLILVDRLRCGKDSS